MRFITAGACSGFNSIKRLGVLLPGWDAGPSQDTSPTAAGTHLLLDGSREAIEVKQFGNPAIVHCKSIELSKATLLLKEKVGPTPPGQA